MAYRNPRAAAIVKPFRRHTHVHNSLFCEGTATQIDLAELPQCEDVHGVISFRGSRHKSWLLLHDFLAKTIDLVNHSTIHGQLGSTVQGGCARFHVFHVFRVCTDSGVRTEPQW